MQLVWIGLIGAGAAVVTGLLFGAALKVAHRPSVVIGEAFPHQFELKEENKRRQRVKVR